MRTFEAEISDSDGNVLGKVQFQCEAYVSRHDLIISNISEVVDQTMIDKSGLEIGGLKFTPEQVKAIIISLDSSKRVDWLYGNTPSPWDRSDCQKWLTDHSIYWY